jgi:hypothetical protein
MKQYYISFFVTLIHILFAKMLVKMFHMSLKYIRLLHVSTSLSHLQVTFFFQGLSRTAHCHSYSWVCRCIFIFGGIWCPLFLFFVLLLLCAPLGVRLLVACMLCWFCVLCFVVHSIWRCQYLGLYSVKWQDDWWIMNWKGSVRNQLWPNEGNIPEFSWRDRKSAKDLIQDSQCPGRNLNQAPLE